MKALNIYIGIIVILALCMGAYMVFFYHPGEVKEIMEKNKKEKADFESKIAEHEAKEAEQDKIIKAQEAVNSGAEKKQKEAETALEKLQKEHEKAPRPVDPKTMKDLEQCQGLYSTLTITLHESEKLTAGTQKALDGCNQLRLFQKSQIDNFKLGMTLKTEIIKTQAGEIKRLNVTVGDLYKAKKPAWWEYGAAFVLGFAIASIK